MITGIVLAAGTSSRLGRPKQLLDLRGKPVLQHVVDAAQSSSLDEIVVVLGHMAERIAELVEVSGRARIAVNEDYAEGQSTSFRAGLLAAGGSSVAAVILLGDQPEVRPEAIEAVVDAWRAAPGGQPVIQASYSGWPAHPILFARRLWPELQSATGDQGARSLLVAHPQWRRLIEIGGRPPADIDTEEDYRKLRGPAG